MKIRTWHQGMSDKDTADLAYWERNMLALLHAEGWYRDQIEIGKRYNGLMKEELPVWAPRYEGWERVLSLEGGRITFHIPDDFDVGHLPEIVPNWDGHSTEEKWRMIAKRCGIEVECDELRTPDIRIQISLKSMHFLENFMSAGETYDTAIRRLREQLTDITKTVG